MEAGPSQSIPVRRRQRANSYGLASVGHDQRIRPPPSKPTVLQFPLHTPSCKEETLGGSDASALRTLLLSIKQPSDVGVQHINAFKVNLTRDVGFFTIIPTRATTFVPPLGWWDDDSSDDGCAVADSPPSRPKLSNGNTAPGKSRYDPVKNELLLNNEDAYREIRREPPLEGRPRVRLTQSRKFFHGLEQMSQWWDSSKDEYTTEKAEPAQVKKNDDLDPVTDELVHAQSTQATKESETSIIYTGLRIGAGSEMPETFRNETIKAFVEMVAWQFGCQLNISQVQPRLTIQDMYFPVRHTYNVNRAPQDRQLARSGIQEGPVMTIQNRPETNFRDPTTPPGEGQYEMCDLLREVGAMLVLAQERARESTTETRGGQGKWWTSIPRWGGGLGGEMGDNEELNKDEDLDARISKPKSKETILRQRKRDMVERWKMIQPAASTWAKRVRYMRIGKDKNSEYDDIFMISSINHHISVLRLKVHPEYLIWLANGTVPSAPSAVPLNLMRTRWYDLFNQTDRVELMDGLWGLFGYMMRRDEA